MLWYLRRWHKLKTCWNQNFVWKVKHFLEDFEIVNIFNNNKIIFVLLLNYCCLLVTTSPCFSSLILLAYLFKIRLKSIESDFPTFFICKLTKFIACFSMICLDDIAFVFISGHGNTQVINFYWVEIRFHEKILQCQNGKWRWSLPDTLPRTEI